MNYIGSKLSLLDFIEESIEEVAGKENKTFFDLFAGTGAVGTRFKKKGYTIYANDIQYYSFVLNQHHVANHKHLPFSHLYREIPQLRGSDIADRAEIVCNYLDSIEGSEGFIYRNYCLGGTNKTTPRQYFSDENGMRCDAIRQKIEEWETTSKITKAEYYFLLTSLLESVDRYANTASVYGAFLKKLKRSATKHLVLKAAELIPNEQDHFVFNEDVNTLVKRIEGDILYLDPPYNQRQYATNYHMLETIARYDNPNIHGKTGLRDYKNQKSLFCSRTKVKKAFSDLISNARTKYIFLSYNNEGLLTPTDIKEIMAKRGTYGFFTREHMRFKADTDKNRIHKAKKTTEYLHYVVCK